ncbi:MAG: GGDEF domain-containing protein, partial [Betaproteobacteria bacterium]
FQRASVQMLELNSSLENARRELVHLNRELKRRETIIQKLSVTDAMTGVGNRRYFDDTLLVETERATRYNQPLSLILLDIDLFKQVTDTWGQATGDFVLREIGTLLQEIMRKSDSAARFGSDEFVLLMPEASVIQAAAVAESLRQKIAEHDMRKAGNITASFGVAGLGVGESAKSLLACADAALYFAKEKGRNCVVSASSEVLFCGAGV